MNVSEKPILVVPLIKKSTAASIEYWSIIFTDVAVYFLKLNSSYVPGVSGVVVDDIYSIRSKSKLDVSLSQNMDVVLQNTMLYYRLTPNEFDSIEIERGPFRFKVVLTYGTKKVLVLRVWNKYYKGFIHMLNRKARNDYIALSASFVFLVCGTLLILFGIGNGIILVGIAILMAVGNIIYRVIERRSKESVNSK